MRVLCGGRDIVNAPALSEFYGKTLFIMDAKLLEILVCPLCKSPLLYLKAAQELICKADRLAFQIVDDIPVMLADEARKLSAEAVEALK